VIELRGPTDDYCHPSPKWGSLCMGDAVAAIKFSGGNISAIQALRPVGAISTKESKVGTLHAR